MIRRFIHSAFSPMDFTDLLFILLLAALAGFWLDSLRALETARNAGKRACNSAGVQFLDDTVTVTALTLRRDAVGHLAIRRTYRFEFSDTGDIPSNSILYIFRRFGNLVPRKIAVL